MVKELSPKFGIISRKFFPNKTAYQLKAIYNGLKPDPLSEKEVDKIIGEGLFHCIIRNYSNTVCTRNNFTDYDLNKTEAKLPINEEYILRQTANNRVEAVESLFNILKEQNQELVKNLLYNSIKILGSNILTKEQKTNIIFGFQSFKKACEMIENMGQQNK